MPSDSNYIDTALFSELDHCDLCPRNCYSSRNSGKVGVCGSDSAFNISSICIHRGEEPAISGLNGICNIFFSRCNLSCIYCQNWQISCNKGRVQEFKMNPDEVIEQICSLLDQGCHAVGFVSPSHYIPHVKLIINKLRDIGRNPVFVYNTNGYDKVEELRKLDGLIDVYLPDFKYMDPNLARDFSGVADYPEVAKMALKEMYRQKGSGLITDEQGQALSGLIVRHLILPGHTANSLEVLRWISENLSVSLALSLMSQYYPVSAVLDHKDLSRTITPQEYEEVVNEMHHLGFYKGWVQELESNSVYRPDFSMEHPFEYEKKEL